MKKSTLVLSTLLCLGIAPLCIAQPAAPTPNQLLNIGKSNIHNKDYVKAEANARKSLSLASSPKDKGDALMLLGETFYERKMYDQARVYWSRAAALTSPEGEIELRGHVALASSYLVQGQALKAIAEYKTGLTIADAQPDVPKHIRDVVSFLLGNAYYRNQQFELARRQFEALVNDAEADSDLKMIALSRLSSTNIFLKDIKGAITNLRQLSDLEGATATDKEYAQLLTEVLVSSDSVEEKVQYFSRLQPDTNGLDATVDFYFRVFL